MPPKKKKGRKKKKKGDGEMTAEDKHKRALEEVEALKDHLAFRKELARRSQSTGEECRFRMAAAEVALDDQQETQKAVSSEMTRQYKTMQMELSLKVHQLDTELQHTRVKLEHTEAQLQRTQQEKDEMCKQKDMEIARLQTSIELMGDQFIEIVKKNMERMKVMLDDEAVGKWSQRAQMIQTHNKQTLLEFGLNPLDI